MKKGKKVFYSGGCLFKIELLDREGSAIEGTFYKDCVDVFFDRIEEGKVYRFGDASVANANKKFTSIQNDYRIIFKSDSLIEPADAEEIKVKAAFNFTPIREVHEISEIQQLDVCGLVLCEIGREKDLVASFDHGKETQVGRLGFTIRDFSNH